MIQSVRTSHPISYYGKDSPEVGGRGGRTVTVAKSTPDPGKKFS